ncbi:hypothetical protein IMCC3317_20940 [Kordia antarctica]|uniref:HTH cro/C1-type domain-containing protein n=1 Tax=Kordia antarctica TaxID=1218801 RepID=A0A7L4ZLB7_9FLAO|nr:hypothetical protein [Kordia antarctica]QHI36724.1 hypothetical protein IMCC3317_20940 [Kordia antarctica]
MSEIGKRFKELIIANDDTNKSFASKIAVNANYISMMINGRKPVSDSILYGIKKVLPTFNEDWLMKGEGTMFINENDAKPETLEDKFSAISDDEVALYFEENKERLLQNNIIKVIIEKEVSGLFVMKLKEDIKKLIND